MTRPRWIVSAFIVWHLTCVVIAALPTDTWQPRETPATPVWVAFAGPFNALTRMMDGLTWAVTAPIVDFRRALDKAVGTPAGWYVGMTGLAQSWAMFSNPPQYDRYWRVRYYIEAPGGRPWMATELIGPSHREDQVRLFQSYRDSYRDKAFEIAFDGFVKRRKASAIEPGARPEDLPDDLAPIGRYFARHFAARLRDGERIIRTEIWVGTVANKKPGEPVDAAVAIERRAALLGYTEGPVEERLSVRPYPPYHGLETEGDIEWLLEYYEQS